jgi:hypothetical protein
MIPTQIPAPRPTVIPDTGADGQPQAMLITPTRATVIDAALARVLLPELLAVLAPAPAGTAESLTA